MKIRYKNAASLAAFVSPKVPPRTFLHVRSRVWDHFGSVALPHLLDPVTAMFDRPVR